MRRLIYFFLSILVTVPAMAATMLRLHQPAAGVSGYQAMTLALGPTGAAVTTSVTNTTASGTSIQVTATGGGSTIAWMSEPVSNTPTLSGTETLNFYGKEASAANNASVQFSLYKYSGGSLGSAFCTGTWGTELTTSIATHAPTCAASSTSFAAGDRLVLKAFVVNCATSGCPTGTMGRVSRRNSYYDGPTASSDGDTNLALAETVTFNPEGGSGGTPTLVQTENDSDYVPEYLGGGSKVLSGQYITAGFNSPTGVNNLLVALVSSDSTAQFPHPERRRQQRLVFRRVVQRQWKR